MREHWALRLALPKGPNWVGIFPLTWGRKQIQFPKRRIFYFLEYQTMRKVKKTVILWTNINLWTGSFQQTQQSRRLPSPTWGRKQIQSPKTCVFQNTERWINSLKPVIPSVTYLRQNPLECSFPNIIMVQVMVRPQTLTNSSLWPI
jgi:hypothetical protein